MIAANPSIYASMNVVGWVMVSVGKGIICGLSVFVTIVLAGKNRWTETPDYVI